MATSDEGTQTGAQPAPGNGSDPDAGPVNADLTQGLLHDWPLRPWILAGLLGACGLLIYLITDNAADEEPVLAAAAAFVGFGGLAAAFTLNARKPIEAGLFALLVGLVMGGIAWHVVAADDHRAGTEFAFAAGCFFTLLALPLFQAGFHRTRLATDYKDTHFHVWADAVSGGGALAFTGLSWLLLALLDGLFGLVGIDIFGDLMGEEWFGWTWSGAAFGAGLGVIRNNLKVIGALQNVVMLVFAILAVPFAAALLVFLLILLASGGNALWEATDSATPILLACAAGAFILFNAIIRDSDEERSANKVMKIAALVLAAVILPLTVFAAISMGIRIDQYGLAPERIWALIAIAVATAYGIACWVALARGRRARWSVKLREANLHLAAIVCVLALILSLPLWDFGAMSARNQIARLTQGKVSVENFDFAALRWDFGDAGRAALAKLADGEGEVARLAVEAQDQESRPYRYGPRDGQSASERLANFSSQTGDSQVDEAFQTLIRSEPWMCSAKCTALDLGTVKEGQRQFVLVEGNGVTHFRLNQSGQMEQRYDFAPDYQQADDSQSDGAQGVEIRRVTVRRVYVDGRAVGAVFE